MAMMTRVDVSHVAVQSRSDGAPVFVADSMTYKVEGGTLWFSMKDEKGEVFAVGKVPHDRALDFVARAAVDLGGELRGIS